MAFSEPERPDVPVSQQNQVKIPAIQEALTDTPQKGTASTAQTLPVPVQDIQPVPVVGDTPLSMDWLADDTASLTLRDVLTPEKQQAFKPYKEGDLPHASGVFWLRLPLSSPFPAEPVLDLNTRIADQIPGIPQVWFAQSDGTGIPLRSTSSGLYPLPSSVSEGSAIYLRISGLPAPGFEPLLISKASIGFVDEMGKAALLAILALSLFICLLRGFTERREWRMWAALYIAAVWVQAFWGLPSTTSGVVSRWDLPGLLAPGVALLILPHVGRHVMQTRSHAPVLDFLYTVIGLVGMVLAAIPLIPDYAWMLRYLPFWPLFTLLLLPLCLAGCLHRLPGSKRFLLICLLPPIGVLIPTLFTLQENEWLTTGVITLLPTIGVTLSALLSALIRSPKQLPVPNRKKNNRRTERRSGEDSVQLGFDAPLSMVKEDEQGLVLHGLDEPAPARPRTESVLAVNDALQHEGRSRSILPGALRTTLTSGQVEGLLRAPMDALLREISALDQLHLSPEARARLDALSKAGRTLTGLIGNMSRTAVQPEKAVSPQLTETFDLNQLLLEVHDAVEEQAAAKNLGLTWFTAPHLPRYYDGQRIQLAEVLEMLTESAVLATDHGMVQIRAQRVPESTDPGHLLFTISDTGSGTPPFSRSSLAFVRAWELAAAGGNCVSLVSKPEGTTVSFSMHLTARSAEVPLTSPEITDKELISKLPASSLRILVVSGVPANRQLLAYYLNELPHEVLEARSPEEAQQMYCTAPGALIIFDDDMPEEAIAKAIATIRIFEGEHNFPLASILALVSNDTQAARLRRAGCTHTLMKPVVRKELRHLTLRLAPVPRRYKVPEPVEETPAQDQSVQAQPLSSQGQSELSLSEARSDHKKKPGLLARLFGHRKSAKKRQEETIAILQPESGTQEKGKLSSVGDPMPISRLTDDTHPDMPSEKADSSPSRKELQQSEKQNSRSALHFRRRQPAPAVHSSFPDNQMFSSSEWVGEPTPILPKKDTGQSQPDIQEPAARQDHADRLEWVGEPVPVSPPKDSRKKEEPLSLSPLTMSETPSEKISPSRHSEAPIDLIEWVGEPMPIPKKDGPLSLTPPVRTGLELVETSTKGNSVSSSTEDQIITLGRPIKERANVEHAPVTSEIPDLFGTLSRQASNTPEADSIVELDTPAEETSPSPSVFSQDLHQDTEKKEESTNENYSISEKRQSEAVSAPVAEEQQVSFSPKEKSQGEDSDATIQCLLQELDVALEQIISGQKWNDANTVRKAASRIAKLAETFDLRVLDDPARCIEIAAEGGDMEEIAQIIPDLAAAIARNRTSFEEKN